MINTLRFSALYKKDVAILKDSQRTIITKRMLKEGLLRLLKTKPLDKISIAELCRESGINRTTFYRHYEVPKDILKEMQTEFIKEMRESLVKPLTENNFKQILVYLQQHSELVKLFIRYNSDTEWTEMFRTLYQNICESKKIDQLDPESQRLFYTYLAGGTYFLLRQWLIDGICKTPEDVSTIVLNILNKNILF